MFFVAEQPRFGLSALSSSFWPMLCWPHPVVAGGPPRCWPSEDSAASASRVSTRLRRSVGMKTHRPRDTESTAAELITRRALLLGGVAAWRSTGVLGARLRQYAGQAGRRNTVMLADREPHQPARLLAAGCAGSSSTATACCSPATSRTIPDRHRARGRRRPRRSRCDRLRQLIVRLEPDELRPRCWPR